MKFNSDFPHYSVWLRHVLQKITKCYIHVPTTAVPRNSRTLFRKRYGLPNSWSLEISHLHRVRSVNNLAHSSATFNGFIYPMWLSIDGQQIHPQKTDKVKSATFVLHSHRHPRPQAHPHLFDHLHRHYLRHYLAWTMTLTSFFIIICIGSVWGGRESLFASLCLIRSIEMLNDDPDLNEYPRNCFIDYPTIASKAISVGLI